MRNIRTISIGWAELEVGPMFGAHLQYKPVFYPRQREAGAGSTASGDMLIMRARGFAARLLAYYCLLVGQPEGPLDCNFPT